MAASFNGWNYGKWDFNFSDSYVVRAGIKLDEPWAYRCSIERYCPGNMPGINVEFFKKLMLRLSLNYKFFACKPWVFTEDEITGCPRDLMDGKLDVIVGPSSYSASRERYIDFTRPVMYFQFGALIKKQLTTPVTQDPRNDIGGALLILLACIVLLDFLMPSGERSNAVPVRKIFATIFGLYILVIENTTFILYSNLMTSRALQPGVAHPFQTFEELVQLLLNKERQLLGFQNNNHPGIGLWEYIEPVLSMEETYFSSLKNYLTLPVNSYVKQATGDAVKSLEDDPTLTLIASASSIKFREAKNPTMLAITEHTSRVSKWYSYMVQNGSALRELLSDAILSEISNLQYLSLIDKYVSREKLRRPSTDPNKPLTLNLLFLPAKVMTIGFSAAIGLVIMETWLRKFCSHGKKKDFSLRYIPAIHSEISRNV